ncbi:MAG: endopeptidase La [Bdellovibrionales bacterium]
MSFDENKLEIPESLPMIPVRDLVIFPYMILPLFVGRESSIKAVEESLAKNRMIFLSSQKDLKEETPTPDSIYETGTVAMIMRMRKLADGRVKILIQGVAKGRVKKYHTTGDHFSVSVEKIDESDQKPLVEVEAMMRNAKEMIERIISLGKMLTPDILLILDDVADAGRFADLIASNLGLRVPEAQDILETKDHKERLAKVCELLNAELEVLSMQNKIRNTAKDEMNKSQREYFLREQLRAIKNELGEADAKGDDFDELRDKLMHAGMPADVEEEAMKQMGRLEKMHPDASEASMIRTYLDLMGDLPWAKASEDNLDLKHAKEVLDTDHHDLSVIKDRILEFLAVRQLMKNDMKGPILCFAGPPGVGKTSLGKSIARAMGREYQRISLGGVKDEAEVRGHRRTYVGAMPGKILQAIKQAGTNNPVIVLDEIDKLGSDFRGDPSAAMLEVLDPEQNATFRDNYLNVDFDLSQVMFLATANVIENIPQALKDRMELIHLSGYTEDDKLLISRKHLIDRQVKSNGITHEDIDFTDEGLAAIISGYTRESGLRNLEREIGSVCRKVAKNRLLDGVTEKATIDKKSVSDLLGPAKFIRDEEMGDDQIGICTGLAWTAVGGEVLFIESIKMKGKGGMVLTGQLGDVMKESAKAAMNYARSNSEALGIESSWFEDNEVHVHIPAGATPKDGPSAGITMATALISLMTDQPVRSDVAMTGEVTLTGRVLPIGGLKEKALAALRHGVKDVIIPYQNKKDLADIPDMFKDQLNFIPVKHLDEVLAVALNKSTKKSDKSKGGSSSSKRPKVAVSVS